MLEQHQTTINLITIMVIVVCKGLKNIETDQMNTNLWKITKIYLLGN